MANYKPRVNTVNASAIAANNGGMISQSVLTTVWNLVLVRGIANHSTGVLASGGVAVWLTTSAGATGSPNGNTFTDSNGLYGITVPTGKAVTLRFYQHV